MREDGFGQAFRAACSCLCPDGAEAILDGTDEIFMKKALRLARRGSGRTSPNPMVGAVVVLDGVAVATGWYRGPGSPHAEVDALAKAGTKARGSTLYLNLEPCSHVGMTPPCTDAVVSAGVRRAVVAMIDPDPRVHGEGVSELKARGVEIDVGLMRDEAQRLNEAYIVHRKFGRPFVTYKAAISLDGRTAAADASSKWITSEAARAEVQHMRASSDAICVGIGTVLTDDPSLTVRNRRVKKQPVRVVVDSSLRTPDGAKVLTVDAATVLITSTDVASKEFPGHVDVIGVQQEDYGLSLKAMLEALAKREVVSLLLEGGGTLAGAFAAQGLIDKYVLFVAPKLLGSRGTRGLLESWGAASIESAQPLEIESVRKFGDDLRIVAYPSRKGNA